MSKKRKHYAASFKVKVALAALKGDQTTMPVKPWVCLETPSIATVMLMDTLNDHSLYKRNIIQRAGS
ncbi:hypothetical protein N9V90_02560 [Endozoicomonas sp.]|nr:hypothetical protein [Endozoicomonas sp.]